MRKVLLLILVMVIAAGCEAPPKNTYGGRNDSGYIDNYYVVSVYDGNGRIMCSYPIDDTTSYYDLYKFDCPEDLEPKIFLGD